MNFITFNFITRTMKLLMITGLGSARDLASGKRGAFYNTLEEFHKYWERVDIICPRVKNEPSSRGHSAELSRGPQVEGRLKVKNLFGNVYVHISPWPLVFHPLWFLKKGLEIYKEQKFDLMTVHEFPPFYNGIGARLLWQKIRVPYVLEIFHIPGHPQAASTKEFIYKILFKLFIKFDASKAKAIRVMNQNQVPDFLIKAGISKERIIYIPAIYIDIDIFKPTGVEKEYDLIFIGRIEKNKGVNLFIESVAKIGAKAVIVGEGSLKKRLRDISHKLQANITFHGWAKDSHEIAQFLNRSRVLVMPSYNEGGPRVVLEAMACGIPVLASPVGVVPDIVRDGKSGRIIKWSSEDVALKMKELLSNTEEYNKYRQAGLEVVKQFEKKAAIKNYAEKLKSLSSS